MKLITILLTTLICSSTYGQDNKSTSSQQGKNSIRIGIAFSPDITHRKLPANTFAADLRKNETSKLGYTTGVNFSFNKNKTLGFETGLLYSNKGYQRKNKRLLPEQQPDPVMPTTATFIYHYNYIDIPLKVNVTFGDRKVRFISGAGIVTNILLSETQTYIFKYPNGNTERETQPSTFENKKINISPVISVGVDYKINEKTNARVEPTFRYGLMQPYLWSAGLNFGCYFSLK